MYNVIFTLCKYKARASIHVRPEPEVMLEAVSEARSELERRLARAATGSGLWARSLRSRLSRENRGSEVRRSRLRGDQLLDRFEDDQAVVS